MTDRRVLLVIGASSDMGLELIRNVHGDFDDIIAHYNKSETELLKLGLGGKIKPLQADFADEKSTEDFIAGIEGLCGCPTHIVHFSAGKVRYARFHQGEWGNVERDLHIQLRSAYKIISRFIRPMTGLGRAAIVFVLTSNTVSPAKYMADYTTVKFALLGLMKSLAAEYAGKPISVNAVSPSMTETKFLSELPEAAVRQAAAASPAGRNAAVQDIIPAVRFLLSDGAAFITGQNITISGGGVI